ncbi:unnamed protein product [Blumeria hordei]|uniref:Uncharacterized protein n=1 Tax=Blumeria hordei TaxID=2867405 RepID=A0A383ULQ4_BLUHO|nr:unnamed protein product [Blumeria hordei]
MNPITSMSHSAHKLAFASDGRAESCTLLTTDRTRGTTCKQLPAFTHEHSSYTSTIEQSSPAIPRLVL